MVSPNFIGAGNCPVCGGFHGYNLDYTSTPGRGYGAGYKDAWQGIYRPSSVITAIRGYDAGHCAGQADKRKEAAGIC